MCWVSLGLWVWVCLRVSLTVCIWVSLELWYVLGCLWDMGVCCSISDSGGVLGYLWDCGCVLRCVWDVGVCWGTYGCVCVGVSL